MPMYLQHSLHSFFCELHKKLPVTSLRITCWVRIGPLIQRESGCTIEGGIVFAVMNNYSTEETKLESTR